MKRILALAVLLGFLTPVVVSGAEPEVIVKLRGSLSPDDPKDAVTKGPYQTLEVKLAAGNTYTIDLESKEFDAFLRLEGPNGKVLARDDDGGGGLNARLTIRVSEDELYRVVVTTLPPKGNGQYTLTIRKAAAK